MNSANKEIQIHQLYNIYGSYTKVGRLMGLSRQRIHQVVKNYHHSGKSNRKAIYNAAWKPICEVCKIPTQVLHHRDFNNQNEHINNLQPLCKKCHTYIHKIHLKNVSPTRCLSCNRILGQEIKYYNIKDGLCHTCNKIKLGEISGKRLFYRKNCKECNIPLKKGLRKKEMCMRCFYRWRYHNNEKIRIYHQNYYQQRRQNPLYVEYQKEVCRQQYIRKQLDL